MNKHLLAQTTRRAILEAAGRIVQVQGSDALTLAAVAQAAGVSKGGLLYHFGSKEALIVGMVEYLLAGFDAAIERELALEPVGLAGRWTRAYLRATFSADQQQLEASAALLVAVATNPALLDPLRERYTRWQQQIEQDGLAPALGLLVRLALDGLWFADLLGLAPPDLVQREVLRLQILVLISE